MDGNEEESKMVRRSSGDESSDRANNNQGEIDESRASHPVVLETNQTDDDQTIDISEEDMERARTIFESYECKEVLNGIMDAILSQKDTVDLRSQHDVIGILRKSLHNFDGFNNGIQNAIARQMWDVIKNEIEDLRIFLPSPSGSHLRSQMETEGAGFSSSSTSHPASGEDTRKSSNKNKSKIGMKYKIACWICGKASHHPKCAIKHGIFKVYDGREWYGRPRDSIKSAKEESKAARKRRKGESNDGQPVYGCPLCPKLKRECECSSCEYNTGKGTDGKTEMIAVPCVFEDGASNKKSRTEVQGDGNDDDDDGDKKPPAKVQ